MKKTSRLLMVTAIASIGLLASCNGGTSTPSVPPLSGNSGTGGSSQTPVQSGYYLQYKGQEVESGDTIQGNVNEPTAMLFAYDLETGNTTTVTYTSSDSSVVSINNNGKMTFHQPGTATITTVGGADNEEKTVTFNITNATTASGTQSYATASYEEKANILGVLENYAVENYLTGITMFSNGGPVVYNSRYVPTPSSYVSGYGWGTMKEGRLTADSTDTTTGHPSYYHTGSTSLFAHANAMDASGSDVSTLAEYITASYYSTRLNATNDGYEWYPSLATEDAPVAVDENGNVIDSSNMNRRWRIYVRTGDKAPVYKTNSIVPEFQKFNNTRVVLEDYLTPFRIMLTGYNGQYRGSELTDGISGITDSSAYYNSTSHAEDDSLYNEELWNDIMGDSSTTDKLNADGERGSLITGSDENGDYIEFKLLSPCTQFYAMYYLSSSLYSPLPMAFVEETGANGLGKSPNGMTPVDTWLSVGAYYIESWSSNQISLKRNDDYYEYKEGYTLNDGVTTRQPYQIPGFDFMKVEDNSQMRNRFESGVIDSYAPDQTSLSAYSELTGTTGRVTWNRFVTEGDGTFKLNVNSMTQEQWEERFGVNGTVQPHAEGDTWECKPYMSNKNFLDFLSFGMDRETFCKNKGMTATQNYFSDNYLIDPESGVSYNSTEAHKAVLADRYDSTYGYNETAARNALREAIEGEGGLAEMAEEDLLTAGSGANPGTSQNPWIITIEMYWMNTDDTITYDGIFDSIERIFKSVVDEDYYGAYQLNIHENAGSGDYNAVYDRMKEGMFDLGFGAITGNALNPINFMEVLKSDNSSDFTLNWGVSTAVESDDIVYDGKTWSYDALWQAADTIAAVSNSGELATVQNLSTHSVTGSSQKYESISGSNSNNGVVTYRLSLETLLQGGAIRDSIQIAVNNGSESQNYTIDEINLNTDNSFILEIGSRFNHVTTTTEGTDGNPVTTTSEASIVTVTVTFNINFNGTEYESSSRLTLPTWYGISIA